MPFVPLYNPRINSVLFEATVCLPDGTEPIALDAIRSILIGMHDAGLRLKMLLTRFSDPEITYAERIRFNVACSSDLWIIIDGIRRFEQVLKYIPDIDESILVPLNLLFGEIRHVRNSFQHIDDRIDKHFAIQGGSVLGEIVWNSRFVAGEPEYIHFLNTGMVKKSIDVHFDSKIKENNSIGVYNLYLRHVIFIKGEEPALTWVGMDLAIRLINQLITFLVDRYDNRLLYGDLKNASRDHVPILSSHQLGDESYKKK